MRNKRVVFKASSPRNITFNEEEDIGVIGDFLDDDDLDKITDETGAIKQQQLIDLLYQKIEDSIDDFIADLIDVWIELRDDD